MLNKILVPIDSIEQENTLNAVKAGIRLSRDCSVEQEGEVIFMHVFYVKPRVSISERDRIIEAKDAKIKEEFETIEEICEEEGVENYRTVLRQGDPAKEIVKLALEEEVDLITMGSGRLHDKSTIGGLQKFFYGSVTEEVIHETPCSILATRPDIGLGKILVPVDSIEWDNTAAGVQNAIEFLGGCRIEQPELILMHVLHSVREEVGGFEEDKLELEKRRVMNEFDQIKQVCEEKGVRNVRTIIKKGDPEKKKGIDLEIAETAKEEEVDIIVMGSGKLHDRSAGGRINKFLYGSVTEDVLHEASCSVVVARPLD